MVGVGLRSDADGPVPRPWIPAKTGNPGRLATGATLMRHWI